jgi:tRNA-specific 2-thiouridylase
MSQPSVILGMSGGVDSSVAALLLTQQGYRVHGVTLQIWEHEDETVAASKRWEERGCCKVGLARFVAQRLNIPFEVIDTREPFQRSVIDDFVTGYSEGTTPNPCVRCNERVKIKALYELARRRDIDYVATGHYARISSHDGRLALTRAADAKKDQSYFLYRLPQDWLGRMRFPLGDIQKSDVWKLAETLSLPVDELKESQEICFVSHGDYRTFLKTEAPDLQNPGPLIDTIGRVLGTHEGIAFYTPGQRRGLGVAAGHRLYVQRVEPSTNAVVLGPEESLLRSDCHVADLNVFDPTLFGQAVEAEVKIRYATPPTRATLTPLLNGEVFVRFHTPQRALSPGQSAVFYQADRVLGGGIIQ